MAHEFRYAIEYQTEGGRWVRLQTFARPLDADRAFEPIVAMGVKLPIRQVRFSYTVVAEFHPGEADGDD